MLSGQIKFQNSSQQQPIFFPTLTPNNQNLTHLRAQSDGHREAERDIVKKIDRDKQKLDSLLNRSTDTLFNLSSVFPFDFFPDQIIIDINKVSVIFNYFYFSRHIHSIYIRDITDVMVETGPFFAVLKIVDYGFTENSIDVSWLVKDQALKARRIIQGLVVAHKEGIELSAFDPIEIALKMEELGKTHRSA